MSAKLPRGRKRETTGVGPSRQSKRPKRDAFEHVAFCSELFSAIKAVRDADGRPISDTLQRAPSRRNEPEYYNVIERAIDLSRINQKVNAEEYNSFEEMCVDIELLIQNTLSFYKIDTIEHQHATLLQNVYNAEKDRILNHTADRPDSRDERLSSTPSTASTSAKKESSSPAPLEEWRMEAVVCAILEEHDRDGRLLCPPFRVLMSLEAFPMYYQIIKEPIDLQKIAHRIRDGEYTNWAEFGNDLKLMYNNAKQFNQSSSVIYKDANYLSTVTKQKLQHFASCKKLSPAEINRNKVMIDELLTQAFVSDNEEGGTSEDSNDEEAPADNDLWKIYMKIRHAEHAEPFLVLPDKRLYPDYYEDEDITSPVSIFLVNSRLKKGKYTSLIELVRDLQLMCRNAMTYNIEGSTVYESAVEIDSLIVRTARELDPTIDVKPTVVETEKLDPPQPKPPKKLRPRKVQEVKEEEDDEEDDEEYPEPCIEEEVSQATTDTVNDLSLLHKPSIGSDDGTNQSDVNSVTSSTPRKKKNRGVPPSRLPGAAETRAQLIPKRSKKNTTGEKLRPGRKSFNELRELYKCKLLEIYKAVTDLKANGRQVCAEFMFRPDPHRFPDYYNIIENPIDMVTMRHRIENGEYQTSETFMDDFRLLFSNARKFNHPDSQIYADANQLENLVLNTMMRITNNTVLRYPPPSKRTPNFFSEVGSPPGASPLNLNNARARPAGEKSTPSRIAAQQISPLQVKMNEVLDRICDVQSSDGRKLSILFQKLPSKQEYPDYYNIIRKPMDLSRIRQKLDNNQYETQRNFFADLKLVFENACKFNEPDSQIYKDALTLQQEIIEICAEDADDEKSVPSVQSQVRRILTNLLVAVNNYTEKGRCLSNSFTEIADLFCKNGIAIDEMPFTLDQIKMNLDKSRYKRLDRFQDDVFGLFSRVRALTRPESQLFLDSIDLQKLFISKREELCKGVLVSPASSFTESDLWDEVEARKKAFKKEKSPVACAENEADSSVESAKASLTEMDESDKSKESEEVLESVEFNNVTYRSKDYVYVAPGEDSALNDNQKHLFRIEKITPDPDNKGVVLLQGLWVFRPSETYHLPKRKFYEKEVFLTPNKGSVTLDRLRGKCIVLYLDNYFQFKPTEFQEEDIYVCEYKYLGRKLHFKRFNTWPYAEEIKELAKEPRPEDFNPQKSMTSEFVSRENSLAPTQKNEIVDDDGDIDERMRNLPNVLDVHRAEVMMRRNKPPRDDETNEDTVDGDDSKEITYFEQVFLNGSYYRIGDCVLVFNPKKGHCDVMQISRIWQAPDGQGRFFSGMFFARPKEVEHEPSTCFYKREVIAVEQPERVEPLERIQCRCAILTVKQFTVCRPTEIPECDVFVVDHKVSGDPRAQGQYMTYVSHKNYRKMKTFSWSDQVPDDEVYYFKNALNMERKEVSPQVSKVDTTLPVDPGDIDNEERHVNEQMENPNAAKDMSWLANQPKLNAKSKSGYILFSAEVRKRIMSENPEAGFGEVSKMVGVEWKKLTDEQKRQYESRASFIADERAKNDLLTPHSKVLQPGEMRIFVCRWHGCDFQFDNYDGLFDHVRTSHASSDEGKVIEDGEPHYVCLWMTCVKYRANSKPFPTLPRLLRHIREKHMPSSGKVIMPNQRGKHFFQYIPSKESSTKDNPQGLFICQPNGIQVPNAVAHRTAIPLDAKQPSLPTSPTSTTNHSIGSSATPGPSNQPPVTSISHHASVTTSHHQIYHVQHSSHSTSQPAQVVQVINGSSVAYVNAPYQTVIVNQPVSGQHHQVVSSTGQPTGQIVVQHAVGQSIHAHSGTSHQIVVHGAPPAAQNSQTSTIIQPGQGYTQHGAPGPVHVYGSSGTAVQTHNVSSAVPYYTPASHQTSSQHYQVPAASVHSTPPPQQQQMTHAEAARTVVTAQPRPEPLFVPPPNSIKVKHVLHSETYLRYIESLSQLKQRTVSNYDHNLQQNQFSTRVDRRKLPGDWIDKSVIGKKREDEIVQALWRLRDSMLESVVGIRRDAEAL